MSTIDELFTQQELEAYHKNKAYHQAGWFFLRQIYDFCHTIRINLVGKQETHVSLQLILLMRMADCLRVIQTASILGYPHQAGTLCASLWEMMHTVIYFSHTPEGAQKYIEASVEGKEKMPGLLEKNMNWEKLSQKNVTYMYRQKYVNAEELIKLQRSEQDHYRKTCKIKHSHPFHINRVKKIN